MKKAISDHQMDVDLLVIEDGELAVHFFEQMEMDPNQRCPDLVLLDLNLPRISGFEVLERLRKGKKCAAAPVVIMTSSSARIDKDRVSLLGASAYFLKPSSYSEFLKIGGVIKTFVA